MSQHCRANPCCGDVPCTGIPLPQHASGLTAHNKTEELKKAVIKKPIDAVFTEACIMGGKLIGTIEADSKERHQDGEAVMTSSITARYKNIFYTKNSVYYVIKLHE